jgi:quercetin dioxygenase-like cupin family protein
MTVHDSPFLRDASAGNVLGLGFTQVRLVLTGADTDGAFALSEQPLEPRALAGPLHTHARESGFIHVVQGEVGVQVGDEDVHTSTGGTVLIPRGTRHTFWNDSDEPARVLELFTPAGLEAWFFELAEMVGSGAFTLDDIVESGRRYGTELDLESLEPLLARGLRLPGLDP